MHYLKHVTDSHLFSSDPLTPGKPKAACASAMFSHVVLTGSQIGLFLASWQSNRIGNSCCHLAVLPHSEHSLGSSSSIQALVPLLYRNLLSSISLSFYPMCLEVASGLRNCRGVCKWGRKELPNSMCSVTAAAQLAAKFHFFRKILPKQVGFMCAAFPSKRMWRKIPHMGWMCRTNSWPTGRCSGSNTTKIWGVCGKLWACQYGTCRQP